jgi:hypothetical protein
MSDDELDVVRGSDNPFRDAGLSDPDTKLMKADLAAGIMRILRIRNADLNRFTIDRLVRILNRLDGQVQVAISLRPREHRSEDKIEAATAVAS